MKRIIFIVLSALVLTLVPATHACAQWWPNGNEKWPVLGEFREGLACAMNDKGKWGYINKTGKVVK